MEEHVIFYVDLLGFSEAVRGTDAARVKELTRLLKDVAALRGPFKLTEKVTDQTTTVTMRPLISTFSDLIVISYPTKKLHKVSSIDLTSVFVSANKIISPLAVEALKLDLLIRGGATVGKLVHKSGKHGVVLGPALVASYELETRTAIYPRIVVSRVLTEKVAPQLYGMFLLDDPDGLTHLNYFQSLVAWTGGPKKPAAVFEPVVYESVARNVKSLEEEKRYKEWSKWIWFRNKLEQVRSDLETRVIEAERAKV